MARDRVHRLWLEILAALVLVAVAALVRIVFLQVLGLHAPFLTFYPAVMIAALYGGLLPGLLASGLSALLADYYLMPPSGRLVPDDTDQLLSLAIFLMSCTMLSCISEALLRAKRLCMESEKRYRTLVEWAPDAVIVHRDGRFLYANCHTLGIYGTVTREQLHEKHFLDLVHPEDQEAAKLMLRELQDGKMITLQEFRLIADGRVVDVEATGTNIEYEGGPANLFILRDITERRRLERERLQAVEEMGRQEQLLIRQGRFAAMGEMVGNIAHQWRQPLNILGLIVQELPVYNKRGKLDQQYLEESVNRAMQTIGNMSRTIDDFRDFLKPDKARVNFRVSEAIQSAVSLVEGTFRVMGLQIQVLTDEDVSIDGCPNEYAQVILNVLMNAKDALLERKTDHPLIAIRLFSESGKAVLTVTDNAGGIAEEIIDRVFDPYFTTKSPDKGTGIGLFMSKTIVEKDLGGRLTVRNVGEGAEFRIEV